MYFRLCLALSLALLSANVSHGQPASHRLHTLDLQQGDHLRGECVSVSKGVVTWRTSYAGVIQMPLGAIKALECDDVWDLEFSDGSTTRARWAILDGSVMLQSEIFGELRCPLDRLRSAMPAVNARGVASEAPVGSPAAASPDASRPAAEPDRAGATADSSAAFAPSSGEPPPSSLQTMLRQSAILLRPKQWNVSTGLRYGHHRLIFAPDDTRQLALVNNVEYGITPRIEGGVALPIYLTRTTRLIANPNSTQGPVTMRSRRFRSGDPEVRAAMLLFGEGRHRPEAVVVTGLTIPVNPADEGGLFRGRIGLEFLKTSDPGAIFGGIGLVHDGDGWQRSPYRSRDHLTYHLGVAIGLNDELAVGIQAQGTYSPELRARNGTLLLTQQEPVQGRFWFNYRITSSSSIEMAFDAPMSTDSQFTGFEVTYIRRY